MFELCVFFSAIYRLTLSDMNFTDFLLRLQPFFFSLLKYRYTSLIAQVSLVLTAQPFFLHRSLHTYHRWFWVDQGTYLTRASSRNCNKSAGSILSSLVL